MAFTSLPVYPERGFLLPALLENDDRLTGRWDYLAQAIEAGELPSSPLPQVDFLSAPDKGTHKMLLHCVQSVSRHGNLGWGGAEQLRFFLSWLLFGLHHNGQKEMPQEPIGCEGAAERLHEAFDLSLWQENPYDYLGEILQESSYGKRQGFFPTPHTIAELMARMLFGEGEDNRIKTVCDPCVGTGRLLLHASNHSLRLYGMDIDPLLCQATLVNGFLFAPALVRPLPFLDGVQYDKDASADLSESMLAQAPPHIAKRLENTEHDAQEQWRFEPIKKRRKRAGEREPTARQGVLFEP